MVNVWYDRKEGMQIVKAEDCHKCSFCARMLRNYCAHYSGWSKSRHDDYLFCEECILDFRKKQPAHTIEIMRMVLIMERIPPHCILVPNRPPELRDGDGSISVFESEKIKSETTNDYTVHAGRDSIESAQIGSLDYLHDVQERQIKNIAKLDAIFDEQRKAIPILNDNLEDIKKITGNKKEE